MANANRASDLDKSTLSCALDECLLNLALGKDVLAIMPSGFGKSLIFQLFPRLAKAALTLENSAIIVVSPLISIINARPSGTTEKEGREGGYQIPVPSLNLAQIPVTKSKIPLLMIICKIMRIIN